MFTLFLLFSQIQNIWEVLKVLYFYSFFEKCINSSILDFYLIFNLFFICREFYYIQMEKYARQALAEGVKSAEEIRVTTESELYRVLNLHYNRNNHIEVRFGFYIFCELGMVKKHFGGG